MLTRLKEHRVSKPWGRTQVPERFGPTDGEPLGEIWFQRDGSGEDALLVKYLFTSERLSVQVHPGDAAAMAAGHNRGKDEAWLILEAEPGAEIAIGLKDGGPQAMELKDNFGQTTVLKFTSFQRNPSLGAQQFKFDVPKGAEVVNQ